MNIKTYTEATLKLRSLVGGGMILPKGRVIRSGALLFFKHKNRSDANTRSAPLPYDKGEN